MAFCFSEYLCQVSEVYAAAFGKLVEIEIYSAKKKIILTEYVTFFRLKYLDTFQQFFFARSFTFYKKE